MKIFLLPGTALLGLNRSLKILGVVSLLSLSDTVNIYPHQEIVPNCTLSLLIDTKQKNNLAP